MWKRESQSSPENSIAMASLHRLNKVLVLDYMTLLCAEMNMGVNSSRLSPLHHGIATADAQGLPCDMRGAAV